MIRILLFADLQEKMGKDSLAYECDSITIKALKEQLKTAFGLFEIDHVMTAVNEEYAMEDDIVKSGDTVAFIPPVSGG
ncbi:molybdopterin converting factor subunit 1 [Oceanobacillus oncorhynchi]|uniref:molybdopterin converting factor subunit 1 n=1 Tax=Oceanobacillus oncorhynchi TaxID=545501 RepID=UPI001865BF5D|nr:molybdopterin converting factor subunit 1 [Oceanobacillus oncorhynchi]UUI39390.1 molybdopterin converting factor subunit 1 [Oceanobacillus oncorhynchi]